MKTFNEFMDEGIIKKVGSAIRNRKKDKIRKKAKKLIRKYVGSDKDIAKVRNSREKSLALMKKKLG